MGIVPVRSKRNGQRSPVRALLAVIAVVAIFATACGGGASTAETVAASAGETAVLEGEFETFGGPNLNLADVQNTDTVFWFWAPF